ncbi:MAG: ABC transporter substrate-binding protein, partial [Nitrospiraceae bacterium]|nr:ABC transporter substrate-binding protein [Nitrospiraceae bacterium]
MAENRGTGMIRFKSAFRETFGLGPFAIASFVLVILLTLFAVFWFFYSAPPATITMTSGPPGSIFQANAEKYRKVLAASGITLKILTSEGSLQNLKRLADPSSHVDIGFVQGGEADGMDISNLVSLGSLYYAPILVFYRNDKPIDILRQFEGMRLAIGPEGSGTRTLALALLAANGIKPGGATRLLPLEGDKAVQALIDGDVNAVFLMGESASVRNIKRLIYATGVRMVSLSQAEGYSRRIAYLNKMVLPMGSVDFGKNIPGHDVQLIGPAVELVARKGLHPALTDLLIEASQQIYGKAGLLHYQGEFPAPQQHEFRLSPEALRYYKSGKTFLYRALPFRFASLINRVLLVFVPLAVLLIPTIK